MTTTSDTHRDTPPVTASHTDLMAVPDGVEAGGLPADAFAERVLAAVLGAQEMQAVHLGTRLGWYAALAEEGPLTSVELASRTGTHERYAREWLEHQAVAGYVAVDDGRADATARRYHLPAGHAEVLTDADSLAHVAPLARFLAATGRHLEAMVEAYRSGGGVSWEQLGTDAREAQAALNRPLFLRALTQDILPAVPELHAKLSGGARIADVGCGEGWSCVGLARGYPQATVHGFDVDAPSLDAARRHAAGADVSDRVSYTLGDVAADGLPGGDGAYDAVFAFECVHDMPDPVSVLAAMRRACAPDGHVIIMEELTEPEFTAPAGPQERLLYGFSITNCLLDGMAYPGSAGTGTVIRPATMTRYARAAGFTRAEILDVPAESFRFYRLHH
jgi:2-polyprenyl-3-methyl-5-hydroxy-6-metoxy-1,4-benzoquinol methylase